MPKDAPSRITVDELGRKLSDLSIPEEDLAKYFLHDEAASTGTRAELALNPETVEVPPATDVEGRARSAQLLNSANYICKLRREARFQQIVNSGTYKGPLIAAEGDSWFEFPFILKDVIDWVFEDFAVFCRSEAGDTLDNMVRRAEYLDALERTGGRVLLLSGGGNDLVAGGNIAAHLRPFDPRLTPAQYLLPSFGGVLDAAIANIEKIVRTSGRAFPNAAVICHGYDYTVPNDGKWLGKPMAGLGIGNKVLQKAIAREMVDRLNTRLLNLANQSQRVSYVNVRGTVGDGRWHDELHPTDAGYRDVAKKIAAEIRRVTGTRAAPELRAAPTPAARLKAHRRAKLPTRPEAAKARGLSLHVGLNALDPAQYEGWDGALTACEFDAGDMAELARAVGYQPKVLLTAQATRKAVIGAIQAAAKKMKAGDIFLMTYSGHGGQVPDFSGDETLDEPEDFQDETLCLFDGQMVDDELYALWSAFPADARVLVLSDCCHSGSNIKARRVADMVEAATSPDQTPRAMPRAVAARVARRKRDFYKAISAQAATAWSGPVTREMALPVAASVRLVSACQDNQVALDGLTNGLFTGRLLEVWGEGAFQGNYTAFHRAIADLMPPSQTPNLFLTGQQSPAYDAQRPFDI
ncbi:MAG TPA: caspase family protein [Amaricoccus sp.]|nr:caspase family protein [Amaricoccus sp.]